MTEQDIGNMSIPVKDLGAIHLMRTTFWAVTQAFKVGYELYAKAYPEARKIGEEEVKRLKACKTARDLERALKPYEYRADMIRHSAPTWATAYRKFGDCNDACMLIEEVRSGGFPYAIIRIEDGKPKDYDKWHFVYQDTDGPDGHVWGNFNLYGIQDIKHYAKCYWKKANYLVKLDKHFNLQGVEKL